MTKVILRGRNGYKAHDIEDLWAISSEEWAKMPRAKQQELIKQTQDDEDMYWELARDYQAELAEQDSTPNPLAERVAEALSNDKRFYQTFLAGLDTECNIYCS